VDITKEEEGPMVFPVAEVIYYFGCFIFPSTVVVLTVLAMVMKIDIRGWPTKLNGGESRGTWTSG
jgi:hypothetical protein